MKSRLKAHALFLALLTGAGGFFVSIRYGRPRSHISSQEEAPVDAECRRFDPPVPVGSRNVSRAARAADYLVPSSARFDDEGKARPGGFAVGADESPWPNRGAPRPGYGSASTRGAAITKWKGIGPDNSYGDNSFSKREYLRNLLQSGDEANMAQAFTLLWSTPYGTSVYYDRLLALRGIHHHALVSFIVAELATADDPEGVERLSDILHVLRGKAVVDALVNELIKADESSRKDEFLVLLEHRQSADEVSILAKATQRDIPDLTWSAALGLARIGGREACQYLAHAAESERESAPFLYALSQAHAPFSQTILLEQATDLDRSIPVRLAAVHALSAHRSDRVRVVFENATSVEPVLPVAIAMREAIAIFGSERESQAHQPEWKGDLDSERWF